MHTGSRVDGGLEDGDGHHEGRGGRHRLGRRGGGPAPPPPPAAAPTIAVHLLICSGGGAVATYEDDEYNDEEEKPPAAGFGFGNSPMRISMHPHRLSIDPLLCRLSDARKRAGRHKEQMMYVSKELKPAASLYYTYIYI